MFWKTYPKFFGGHTTLLDWISANLGTSDCWEAQVPFCPTEWVYCVLPCIFQRFQQKSHSPTLDLPISWGYFLIWNPFTALKNWTWKMILLPNLANSGPSIFYIKSAWKLASSFLSSSLSWGGLFIYLQQLVRASWYYFQHPTWKSLCSSSSVHWIHLCLLSYHRLCFYQIFFHHKTRVTFLKLSATNFRFCYSSTILLYINYLLTQICFKTKNDKISEAFKINIYLVAGVCVVSYLIQVELRWSWLGLLTCLGGQRLI